MFCRFIKNFRRSRRKHDFDLEFPTVAVYDKIVVEGVPFKQTIFTCSACGAQLGLELADMKRLPRAMGYGCSGSKKDG